MQRSKFEDTQRMLCIPDPRRPAQAETGKDL